MIDDELLSTPTLEARAEIARALRVDPIDEPLSYHRVESEEAQVWRVSAHHAQIEGEVSDTTDAWIKRHKTPQRAWREASALTEWAHHLRGPGLIGYADPQTLILEHIEATPLSAFDLLMSSHLINPLSIELAERLATLHRVTLPDDDPIPLQRALRQRASRTLKQSVALLNLQGSNERFPFTPDLAQALHFARGALSDLISDVQAHELYSPPELMTLYTRVPCHRDLRPEHIYIHYSSEALEFCVSVIDWGQSRPDARLVEWARLYLGLSSSRPIPESKRACMQRLWRDAWRTYIDLTFTQAQRLIANNQLIQLVALEAINTLVWAHNHSSSNSAISNHVELSQVSQVIWARGIRELWAFMSLSEGTSEE